MVSQTENSVLSTQRPKVSKYLVYSYTPVIKHKIWFIFNQHVLTCRGIKKIRHSLFGSDTTRYYFSEIKLIFRDINNTFNSHKKAVSVYFSNSVSIKKKQLAYDLAMISVFSTNLCHWSLSIPLENIRKPVVFWILIFSAWV